VLNGDKEMYGKKYLFDGSDETCWNSDKGAPQKIEFSFSEPKTIRKLNIQFQGGFSAKQIQLENADAEKCEFVPLDTNQLQEFCLDKPITAQDFKLILNSSYDFYGRIIIYHLDILS